MLIFNAFDGPSMVPSGSFPLCMGMYPPPSSPPVPPHSPPLDPPIPPSLPPPGTPPPPTEWNDGFYAADDGSCAPYVGELVDTLQQCEHVHDFFNSGLPFGDVAQVSTGAIPFGCILDWGVNGARRVVFNSLQTSTGTYNEQYRPLCRQTSLVNSNVTLTAEGQLCADDEVVTSEDACNRTIPMLYTILYHEMYGVFGAPSTPELRYLHPPHKLVFNSPDLTQAPHGCVAIYIDQGFFVPTIHVLFNDRPENADLHNTAYRSVCHSGLAGSDPRLLVPANPPSPPNAPPRPPSAPEGFARLPAGAGHSCVSSGGENIASLQGCADAAELLQLSDVVPDQVFSAFYLPGCSCISSSGTHCDLLLFNSFASTSGGSAAAFAICQGVHPPSAPPPASPPIVHCIDGYWPLYGSEATAEAMSPLGTAHSHVLRNHTYHMPDGYTGATHGGSCPSTGIHPFAPPPPPLPGSPPPSTPPGTACVEPHQNPSECTVRIQMRDCVNATGKCLVMTGVTRFHSAWVYGLCLDEDTGAESSACFTSTTPVAASRRSLALAQMSMTVEATSTSVALTPTGDALGLGYPNAVPPGLADHILRVNDGYVFYLAGGELAASLGTRVTRSSFEEYIEFVVPAAYFLSFGSLCPVDDIVEDAQLCLQLINLLENTTADALVNVDDANRPPGCSVREQLGRAPGDPTGTRAPYFNDNLDGNAKANFQPVCLATNYSRLIPPPAPPPQSPVVVYYACDCLEHPEPPSPPSPSLPDLAHPLCYPATIPLFKAVGQVLYSHPVDEDRVREYCLTNTVRKKIELAT